jgi:hypothetical protein
MLEHSEHKQQIIIATKDDINKFNDVLINFLKTMVGKANNYLE